MCSTRHKSNEKQHPASVITFAIEGAPQSKQFLMFKRNCRNGLEDSSCAWEIQHSSAKREREREREA